MKIGYATRILVLIAPAAMMDASKVAAGTPSLVELGRQVPGYATSGPAAFAIADFDGDGRDDIVLPAQSGTALFQVFGQGGSGVVAKQAVFLPDVALAGAFAVTMDGEQQLVTVSTQGVVRRFAGWPLVEVHSFAMEIEEPEIVSAAVGDIDNNGDPDLVTSSGYWNLALDAHALSDGEPRWSLPTSGGHGLLVRQFDADPALEIVVSGTPGKAIDGATQATDWSYAGGFGRFLAAGHFDANGGNQFVAAGGLGPIVGFNSAPWSPIWELEQDNVAALAAADFDGDGFDEIIEADDPWGYVNIIDGQTRAVRLSIPQNGIGMSAVGAWDHDGDGTADVAFAPLDPDWIERPLFRLADSEDGTTLWSLLADQRPAYQQLALARTAAGPRLTYPFGTVTSGGGWTELDASTGQEIWRSPFTVGDDEPFFLAPRTTAYTADGMGLVVAGNSYGDGARFMALDAISHSLRWMLDGRTEPALVNRSVMDMTILEISGSPTIAACVDSGVGKRLLLIDEGAGTLSWNSVSMDDSGLHCGIMAGRFSAGANPLVVAVLESSLRAYDAVTHQLAWTLPGPAAGASLLEHGVAGSEFVMFDGPELRFHDAETRQLLRSFDVGKPVSAVRQVNGNIHGLVIAAGGHLLLVDGTNGSILQATGYLGDRLAEGNRIATTDLAGYALIGIGSEGGVFRYRLDSSEGIFTDGFEPVMD